MRFKARDLRVVESNDKKNKTYSVEITENGRIKFAVPKGAGYKWVEALDTPVDAPGWGDE
jgi:hypothetical protein